MRIPVVDLSFADLGYEGYFAKVPRSVKEGFVNDITRAGTTSKDPTGDESAKASREVNIKVLALVQEWNLTDDANELLPLVKDITVIDIDPNDDRPRSVRLLEAQGKVVAEVPIEIIKAVIEKVTATTKVNERTKDF